MNSITAYIVEDELIVSEEIKEIVSDLGYKVYGSSNSADEAIEEILKKRPDLLLLDINIEGQKDGIDVAQEVSKHYSPIIIFLTAYADKKTIDKAKTIEPDAYLVKPFDERNLAVAIDIAVSNNIGLDEKDQYDQLVFADRFFLKVKGVYRKILFSEVLYIEANGSYCNLILKDGVHTISMNMKNLSYKIQNEKFIRIHRKYIINAENIDSFDANYVFINDKHLPISDSFKENFLKRFKYV